MQDTETDLKHCWRRLLNQQYVKNKTNICNFDININDMGKGGLSTNATTNPRLNTISQPIMSYRHARQALSDITVLC